MASPASAPRSARPTATASSPSSPHTDPLSGVPVLLLAGRSSVFPPAIGVPAGRKAGPRGATPLTVVLSRCVGYATSLFVHTRTGLAHREYLRRSHAPPRAPGRSKPRSLATPQTGPTD